MYYHRAVISYKGSSYFGWQDLGANEEKPTVQATIQQVLKKICKYQDCSISAASRTDGGVHAQGQVAKFSIPIEVESEKLLQGMNSLLPNDIRILKCEACSKAFNPNKDSKSKSYHYYFCVDRISNPVLNDFVAHVSSITENNETDAIDLEKMKQACKLFVGEHDFYSFATRDPNIGSTVRSIFNCEIVKAGLSGFANEVYYLKIEGNGFLRQMIRYIVGSLIAVGRGELGLEDIGEALENHREQKLSPKAKAHGLHLIEICY